MSARTGLHDSRTLHLPDGRMVGYAEYGDLDGTPVLALHGAPASRLMFAVADFEARRHRLRLIAPDRPGYGLSPPDDPATLTRRTDWLRAFTEALHLDRFAILGISGGAPYAVSLAAAIPERTTALMLVSPMGPVADFANTDEAARHPVSFLHRRFFLHLPQRNWLTHSLGELGATLYTWAPDALSGLVPSLTSPVDAAILRRPGVKEAMKAMTLEAFRQGAAGGTRDLEIYSEPWGVAYQRITAPSMVWQGTADTVVPPQVSTYLAEQLPGCVLHKIDGAGHFWVFEHIPEVMDALVDLGARRGTAAEPSR